MKTKLFSLFIAVFLFSFSGNAQSCPDGWNPAYNCISLIGPGSPGGNWETDTYLSTEDGDVYTAVDMQFSKAQIKFRQNTCWDTCPGNPAGWGPVESSQSGWPSGQNTNPVPFGPNIECPGGVWNVKFTLSTQSWEFTAGTPNPVIKLVGSAVADSPLEMSTANGILYTAKKVTLVPGTLQFDIDGLLLGSSDSAFPTGSATDPAGSIPVTTTGVDYDVTFDYTTAVYTFAVATFPKIAIIGSATQQGWPSDPQVDANEMTTTDGETYTISNVPLNGLPDNGNTNYDPDNALKFRQDNSWSNNWGGLSFPTGPTEGADILVTESGNYSCVFTRSTGAYVFTISDIGLIGSATTGTDAGWANDIAKMETVDGMNYTLTQQLYSVNTSNGGGAAVKFRTYGEWKQDWGGKIFPIGPEAGVNSDIFVTADGIYDIKFNRMTGAYDFVASLSTKNFTIAGLKTYPNPTQNNWNITANDQITSVQVFDILGKTVITKTFSSNEVSVSAAKLSRGVYFAKISTAKGSSTVKLVKE